MKKTLIGLIILIALLSLFNQKVLAQPRPLEVKYPPVPEAQPPETVETEVPIYVRYLFNFFIWITGLIALGALIYAGFRYLTSAGQPEAIKDAKEQMLAALAGVLILLSSWLILTTINPQLKQLEIKPAPPILPTLQAGVYLCTKLTVALSGAWELIQEIKKMNPDDPQRKQKIEQLKEDLKEIEEICWRAPTSGEIPEKFNDKAEMAYVVSSETGISSATTTLHGAILYEESNFGGRAQVVYALEPGVFGFDITAIKPSSIRVFVQKKPRTEVYVELFRLIDFNRADPNKKSKKFTIEDLVVTDYYGVSDFIELKSDFPYGDKTKIGSVKIEGDLIVIFFKDEQKENWPPDAIIDVVVNTDATLYDNLMGGWCWEWVWLRRSYYPCPLQMVIVSAGIY